MFEIRPLTKSDIAAALHLSTQAGWNQLEADWLRLLNLFPDRCLAGCVDGRVVASATLATYGHQLGWVGMVLVDQAHRSHGYGTAMLDAVIALGEKLGIGTLGLDATDLGQPLYLKRGFVPATPINRWGGEFAEGRTLFAQQRMPYDRRTWASEKLRDFVDADSSERRKRLAIEADSAPRVIHDIIDGCAAPYGPEWPEILAMDTAAMGLDRGALLQAIANERGVVARIVRQAGQLAGFALARPGRTAAHIGPVIAQSADAGTILIDALLRILTLSANTTTILIDIPQNSVVEDIVARRGLAIRRRLTRMYRPAAPPGSSVSALAATGFELG